MKTAISNGSAAPTKPLDLTFLSPAQQPDELGRLTEDRVMKELGHDGMGAVFQVEEPQLKRKIVLRVMLPHVAKVAVNCERFLREVQPAAQLGYDKIVSVYQVAEANGCRTLPGRFSKVSRCKSVWWMAVSGGHSTCRSAAVASRDRTSLAAIASRSAAAR